MLCMETKSGHRAAGHDRTACSVVAGAPICFTHCSPRAFRMVVQFSTVCWELNCLSDLSLDCC